MANLRKIKKQMDKTYKVNCEFRVDNKQHVWLHIDGVNINIAVGFDRGYTQSGKEAGKMEKHLHQHIKQYLRYGNKYGA